jgi:hypothetical protein
MHDHSPVCMMAWLVRHWLSRRDGWLGLNRPEETPAYICLYDGEKVQSGTAACGMPSPERPRRACAGQPAEGVTYPGALIELPGPRPSSSGSTGTAAELATAVQAFLCGDPVGKAVSALHPDDAAFF